MLQQPVNGAPLSKIMGVMCGTQYSIVLIVSTIPNTVMCNVVKGRTTYHSSHSLHITMNRSGLYGISQVQYLCYTIRHGLTVGGNMSFLPQLQQLQ